MSDTFIGGEFDRMIRLFDLAKICEGSIEQCLDEVCGADDRHPRPLFTRSNSPRTLTNMVDGYINKILGVTKPSVRDWSLGMKRAMTFWNNRDSLCTNEPEAETTPVRATDAKKAPAPDAAKFEINVAVEDAARAGALTAGAALVYKVLLFGATVYPPARPAAQGIMMLLGITPAGFDYESPRDRMIREGA